MKQYSDHTDITDADILNVLQQAEPKGATAKQVLQILMPGKRESGTTEYKYMNRQLRRLMDEGLVARSKGGNGQSYRYSLQLDGTEPEPPVLHSDEPHPDASIDRVLEENREQVEELPEPKEKKEETPRGWQKHLERIEQFEEEHGPSAPPNDPTHCQETGETCVFLNGPVPLPTDDDGFVQNSKQHFGERKRPREVRVKCPHCASIRNPWYSKQWDALVYKRHSVHSSSPYTSEAHYRRTPSKRWVFVPAAEPEESE